MSSAPNPIFSLVWFFITTLIFFIIFRGCTIQGIYKKITEQLTAAEVLAS